MTAFKIICSFLKFQEGYTREDIADRLNVSLDTIKRWAREGYTTRDIAPKDIVSRIFSNNTTLINAFVPYLKENNYPVSDSLKTSEDFTVEEFVKFLALFLADDSNDKFTYSQIMHSRSKAIAQTRKINLRSQKAKEGMIIDFTSSRIFASCGKETTVFNMKKSTEKQEVQLDINFEKTRLRETIPDYSGLYCTFNPIIDLSDAKQIRFEAKSEDKTITKIWVEIKPQGRSWMHESFDFEIDSEYKEFCIDCKGFLYPETLKCMEEITFVIKPESFANEESLKGKLDISNLCIN